MPADVHARKIGHLERPHRHSEIGMDLVDLLRGRTFEQHLICRDLTLTKHPVTDETMADACDDCDLADLFADGHRGREHIVGSLFAPHDLKQFHDVCG